jgi:hypothetical protein
VGQKDRRAFLKHGLVAAGGLVLGLAAWSQLQKTGTSLSHHKSLGPLIPTQDQSTGLPILNLPNGFEYHSFAWAGETLADGYRSPRACDGMGIVADSNGVVTMIRNHELRGSMGATGDPSMAWDNTGGGTTTLKFDTNEKRLVDSGVSLGGTVNNCAGGVTPWGTWLSCEEGPVTPELMHLGTEPRQWLWKLDNAKKRHGFVFEVHPDGAMNPEPIVAMGQFYHEAAAVDPATGVVYMTEDRAPFAGLYRYLPDVPGKLAKGGLLQMLRVTGHSELKGAVSRNQQMSIGWVEIADPEQGHTPGTHDGAGVVAQGMAAGGTGFISLEGCIYYDGSIFFTSKAGGEARLGQVFRLDLENNTLQLIFEATRQSSFSGPDNIIVSPRGSLMICEDRLGTYKDGQCVAALDAMGQLFAFCQTNTDLRGIYGGHELHNTAITSEWAGVCFSEDGQWMFANLYSPGITFAITGPWDDGPV